MKIIYRSVSKIRRQGSFLSWITSSSVQAVATFTKLAKSSGIAYMLKIVISFLLISIIIPILAASLLLSAIYKYTIQMICNKFYPKEELKIIWNMPCSSVFDLKNDNAIATILAIVDGTPNIKKIKSNIADVIKGSECFSSLKKAITTKFGCYVWKNLEYEFKTDDQIFLSVEKWKGKLLNEELLQNYLSELYLYGLPLRSPPWQIIVVPFSDTATYALIIRHHFLLTSHFNEFVKQLLFQNLSNSPTPEIKSTSSIIFSSQITSVFLTLLELIHYFIEVPIYLLKEIMNSKIRYHKQRISGKKSLSWTENLNLDFINKIAERTLVRPNDILLFGIVGALRRYYSVMEGCIPDYLFSMMMHESDFDIFKTCEFSPLVLPLATVDTKHRLLKLITQSKVLKQTQSVPRITSILLNYMNKLLPTILVSIFVESVTKKYSLLINNLHTFSCAKTLWDDDIRMMHYWKFPIKHIGISLSLMYTPHYASLSAITDSSSIQRPDLLMTYFMREINDFAIHLNIRTERKHSPISENYLRKNYLKCDNL